jgi:predicted membrane chloride channel (bestrophin family)
MAMQVQAMFPTERDQLEQLAQGMNYVMKLDDISSEEWEAAGQRNAARQRDIGRLLAALHYINTLHLMGDAALPPEIRKLLTETECKQLRQATVWHRAGVHVTVIGGWISKRLGSPGTPAQMALAAMFQQWTVCRRIASTPLPSTYRTVTDLCLFPWLITLPLLLSSHSQNHSKAVEGFQTEHFVSYVIPAVMTSLITAIYMMLRFLSRHLHNPFAGVVRLPVAMSNHMVLDDLSSMLPRCLDPV